MGSIVIGLILLYLYRFNLGFFDLLIAILLSFIIGLPAVYLGKKFILDIWGPAERHTGKVTSDDFNEICIDEVHGMLISVLPIYFFNFGFVEFFLLHLVAFFSFRFFDSKKIGPVKRIEETDNLPSSMKIMLDDSIAGILALIATSLMTIFVQFVNI